MLSSVEQQDKKGGLKQDMPDIYVSYLLQLLKWFLPLYFTNLRGERRRKIEHFFRILHSYELILKCIFTEQISNIKRP